MSAGSAALLAAGMRAAADLIEACGAAGLHASCYGTGEVSVGVTSHAGDGPARAAILADLALLLEARPGRADSQASPAAWLTADGQLAGIPVHAWAEVAVATATGPGGAPAPLARSADGHLAILPGGQLPAGWRWVTELDGPPGTAAAGRQAVA
jgi:hypothetical protein